MSGPSIQISRPSVVAAILILIFSIPFVPTFLMYVCAALIIYMVVKTFTEMTYSVTYIQLPEGAERLLVHLGNASAIAFMLSMFLLLKYQEQALLYTGIFTFLMWVGIEKWQKDNWEMKF